MINYSRAAGVLFAMMLSCIQGAQAATFVWTGNGANNNWSTAANWSGGVPANDGTATVILAGNNRLTPNVDVNWEIASLIFSNNAGAFTLGGSGLIVRAGGITNSDGSTQTINNAITVRSNQTWSATSGILNINGTVNNTNQLTISGSFNTTL